VALRSGLQKASVDRLDLPEPNIFLNKEGYGAGSIKRRSLSGNIATIEFGGPIYCNEDCNIVVSGLGEAFDGAYPINTIDSENGIITYIRNYDNVALADAPPGAIAYRQEALAYFARYRIKSNQGESTWSPVKKIHANYWFDYPEGVTRANGIRTTSLTATVGKAVSIAWDPISLMIQDREIRKASEYDIWLQWYRNNDAAGTSGKWIYESRIASNSVVFNVPPQYTKVSDSSGEEVLVNQAPNRLNVEVRLRGNPILREMQIQYDPPVFQTSTRLLAYKTTTPASV